MAKEKDVEPVAAHMERIQKAYARVVKAEGIVCQYQAELKQAKAKAETALEQLKAEIRDHDNRLTLGGNGDWNAVTLDELGITGKIAENLTNANLKTLGDIANYTRSYAITDVNGIGPQKAEKVQAALDAWWKDHPQPETQKAKADGEEE